MTVRYFYDGFSKQVGEFEKDLPLKTQYLILENVKSDNENIKDYGVTLNKFFNALNKNNCFDIISCFSVDYVNNDAIFQFKVRNDVINDEFVIEEILRQVIKENLSNNLSDIEEDNNDPFVDKGVVLFSFQYILDESILSQVFNFISNLSNNYNYLSMSISEISSIDEKNLIKVSGNWIIIDKKSAELNVFLTLWSFKALLFGHKISDFIYSFTKEENNFIHKRVKALVDIFNT